MTLAASNLAELRRKAFLRPDGPEVFPSVVQHSHVWTADPFDVPIIHPEARDTFERLLHRAAADVRPDAGRMLLLLGEAGSGKTHLMRAFRTRTHADGIGYCAYLQMTAQTSNYARYVLVNLINSLSQPYRLPDAPEAGLFRLARGLLDFVPGLTAEDRSNFCEGYVPHLAKRVFEYADWIVTDPRFDADSIDLYRGLLFILRDDARVKARAMKWLRCEDLTSFDRDLLGEMIPRVREEDPLDMIVRLGRLMDTLSAAPLVLCVDQLEDTLSHGSTPERFRQVIETLVAIVSALPRSIAIISCLDDYFTGNREHLKRPHLDRLEQDPAPIYVPKNRTIEEVEAIVGRRLQVLYDELDVPCNEQPTIEPFTRDHLLPLVGTRTRDVLDFCRMHQEHCRRVGAWSDPTAAGDGQPPPPPFSSIQLEQAWNDFLAGFQQSTPDEDEERARLLARTIRALAVELPGPSNLAADAQERFVHVAPPREGMGPPFVIGICEKSPQGGGLAKQVSALVARAGGAPIVIVRSTPFPSSPRAQVTKLINDQVEPRGRGRRVVVEDSDWRRMSAFTAFQQIHGKRDDFTAWQVSSHPLSSMPSMRQILALDRLVPCPAPAESPATTTNAAEPPPPTPDAAAPSIRNDSPVPETPPDILPASANAMDPLAVGQRLGLRPEPVSISVDSLLLHSAFLGGTGSGKTTAAMNLVEQLLERGVPAVLIDRKGDLCRYAESTAWEEPTDDPRIREGRKRLRDRLDIAVYTPGKLDGRPLSIPLVPSDFATLNTNDREQYAGYAAAAIGSMIGYKPTQAEKMLLAILGKAIEVLASLPAMPVTIQSLRQIIETRDDALLTAVGGFEDRHYTRLANDLLTLLLRQSALFSEQAEPLKIDELLGVPVRSVQGKTRLTVISTKFLADASQLDFWVAQFLLAVGRWIGKAPCRQLQAILLLDEADIYLPAIRQPATKAPLENLLRRARSAGLGLMLASQNPGDFDYKCRDNIGTWFVGRIGQANSIKKMENLFRDTPGDVAGKLPAQDTGEFHLLQSKSVLPIRSLPSLIRTDQMAEGEILALAARQRSGSSRPPD